MEHTLNRPYTVDEVATLLQVSVKMVWRLCREGQLPAVKIGRKWFIKRPELDAHLGIVAPPAAFPSRSFETRRIKPGPKPRSRDQRLW